MIVLDMVRSTGRALEFAKDHIKADREVVRAAVRTTPTALKFAKGRCSRDSGIMMESGKEEYEQHFYDRKEQAILSVGSHSTDYATNFAVLLKRILFFRQFKRHDPNAWRENCCDPDLTNTSTPCRGTPRTCGFEETQNLIIEAPNGERTPAKQSCWRFSFRCHLEECQATGGFMIQVQDKHGLDDGQRIETEMAQQANVKIFRTMTTSEDVDDQQITVLEQTIQDWYKKGCRNLKMVELQLR